jgi:hypothetical protein
VDGGIEQALAPSLGRLPIARILLDVGDQAGIENAFPVTGGIKAAIEVEVRPPEVSPHRFGHPLQSFQPLWEQHHISLVDGGDGRRS